MRKSLLILHHPYLNPPVFFGVLLGGFVGHYGAALAKAGIMQPFGINTLAYKVSVYGLGPVYRQCGLVSIYVGGIRGILNAAYMPLYTYLQVGVIS